MIKAKKNTACGGKRGNIYTVDVRDMEDALVKDPSHPLFDSRVNNPPCETRIRNFRANGIQKPIVVRKVDTVEIDGVKYDKFEIIEGRQRVINGCELSRRLEEEHGHRVPVAIKLTVFKGSLQEALEIMASSFIRTPDAELSEALKMASLYKLSQDLDYIATQFGASVATVKNRLKLASIPPEAQKLVREGKLSNTEAIEKYAGASDSEVTEEDKERKTTGEKKTRRPRKSPKNKAPNKKTIAKLETAMKFDESIDSSEPLFSLVEVQKVLAWTRGDIKQDALEAYVPILAEYFEKMKGKKQ